MKRNRQEAINNFINNVLLDDAHEQVVITANELLEEDTDFPIIDSAELFMDCVIGYFEHVEDYEMCSRLHKNRTDIETRLIPLSKFMTKGHETLRNFRSPK